MANKCVFVIGATGFVGSNVVSALIKNGYTIKALVRNMGRGYITENIEFVTGDINDNSTWVENLSDAHAVINLVGIIREDKRAGATFKRLHVEAVKSVVDACKKANVKRIIHMSANGANENGIAKYQRTKAEGEEIIKNSGLDYTIFRPSLIYGEKDQFFNMLHAQMAKFRLLPIFGDGKYMLQPISVIDVAECFVKSIDNIECIDKTFHLCGEQAYYYERIIHMLAETIDNNVYTPHITLSVVKPVARFMGFAKSFPITIGQLNMLIEGNVCPESEVFKILDIDRHDMQEYITNKFVK